LSHALLDSSQEALQVWLGGGSHSERMGLNAAGIKLMIA
jgi:hypothetical protein